MKAFWAHSVLNGDFRYFRKSLKSWLQYIGFRPICQVRTRLRVAFTGWFLDWVCLGCAVPAGSPLHCPLTSYGSIHLFNMTAARLSANTPFSVRSVWFKWGQARRERRAMLTRCAPICQLSARPLVPVSEGGSAEGAKLGSFNGERAVKRPRSYERLSLSRG